jgi:hypothetical protein
LETEIVGSTPAMPASMLTVLMWIGIWVAFGILGLVINTLVDYVNDDWVIVDVEDVLFSGVLGTVTLCVAICHVISSVPVRKILNIKIIKFKRKG